jgi:hypothetical protein
MKYSCLTPLLARLKRKLSFEEKSSWSETEAQKRTTFEGFIENEIGADDAFISSAINIQKQPRSDIEFGSRVNSVQSSPFQSNSRSNSIKYSKNSYSGSAIGDQQEEIYKPDSIRRRALTTTGKPLVNLTRRITLTKGSLLDQYHTIESEKSHSNGRPNRLIENNGLMTKCKSYSEFPSESHALLFRNNTRIEFKSDTTFDIRNVVDHRKKRISNERTKNKCHRIPPRPKSGPLKIGTPEAELDSGILARSMSTKIKSKSNYQRQPDYFDDLYVSESVQQQLTKGIHPSESSNSWESYNVHDIDDETPLGNFALLRLQQQLAAEKF